MEKTLVGAIRWDAWVARLNPCAEVYQNNLSNPKYHSRHPFFAKRNEEGKLIIDGIDQKVYDREIDFAKAAGIDYFAVCWYPDGSGLEHQRKLYFSSKKKSQVKWCIIHGTNPFDPDKDMKWLIKEMKEETYQKVLNGRPLVYMFTLNDGQKPFIKKLKNDCIQAGLPMPYIVGMGFSSDISSVAMNLNLDAISAYCFYTTPGSSYAHQRIEEVKRWEEYKKTGMDVIPFITTGFDNRPRFEDSSVKHQEGYMRAYIQEGTPEEIAGHLETGIKWCKNNPDTAKANAVLMYAWNENDEGGYLIPTKDEMEKWGYSPKLRAISKIPR